MKSSNSLFIFFAIVAIGLMPASCIEDGITYSPNDQPIFSADTLDFAEVYTEELTTVRQLKIFNLHKKGIIINDVNITGAAAEYFRLNIDGRGGSSFSNIEIRSNDSIFVLVDAFFPENCSSVPKEIEAALNVSCNNNISSLIIKATAQDVNRIYGETIESDTEYISGKPYIIYDSLVVSENATLRLCEGTVMKFHDKSKLDVKGTLVCDGSYDNPIMLTGDRNGEVLPGVSFDIMSRQWDGVNFMPESSANVMRYTVVSNTSYGMAVYGDGSDLDQPKVLLENCKIRNSGEAALLAFNASVHAYGCEIAEAGYCPVFLLGGNHRFDQCTVANNYLFSVIGSAAWTFVDPADTEEYTDASPTRAVITNCITHGLGNDVSPADLTDTDITFERCLFKSEGEDDSNFINCIWNADPLFYTIRNEYIFDYRLKPDSPAIGAADPSLNDHPLSFDFYGQPRIAHDLGAYVFVEP